MVARTVTTIDNESLIQVAGNPGGTTGAAIINNSDTPVGWRFEYIGGDPVDVVIDDTRNTEVFDDDDPNRHRIIDGQGLVPDGTRVESESVHQFREVDPVTGQLSGPVINVYVFSRDGQTQNVWGLGFDTPLRNGVTYEKISGSNTGDSPYTTFVPCFTAGSLVRTARGPVRVEMLRPGDRVWTLFDGFQPVRWVGITEVVGQGDLAPIEISAGTLGDHADLQVSPQHRIYIEDGRLALAFGDEAALVPAKHLLGLPGVRQAPSDRVRYVHILFDQHQIVEANGLLSESFYPGDMGLAALGGATRDEVLTLFPELASGPETYGALAAMCLNGREAAVMRGLLA